MQCLARGEKLLPQPHQPHAQMDTLDKILALQASAQNEKGLTLTVEQAAAVLNAGAAGQSAAQKGAADAGRLIPLFHGHENVLDFTFAVRRYMGPGQPGVHLTSDQQVDLLVTRLRGPALAFYRKNQQTHSTLVGWLRALESEFSITETGLQAALGKLTFKPQYESLRQFNSRFNEVLDTAAGTLAVDELRRQYLRCLGRGDLQLMRDVINTQPVGSMEISALQRAVAGKVEVYAAMAADLEVAGHGGGPTYDAAQRAYAFDGGIGADQVKRAAGLKRPVAGTEAVIDALKHLGTGNGNGNGSATGQDQGAGSQTLLHRLLTAPQPALPAQHAMTASQTPVATPTPAPSVAGNGTGKPAAGSVPRNLTGAGQPGGPRGCWTCGSLDHLAYNCPHKGKRREMVSKAVQYLLERFDGLDQQGVEPAAAPVAQQQAVVGVLFRPSEAGQAAKAALAAPTTAALYSFGRSLMEYHQAYPDDLVAAGYVDRLLQGGEAAIQAMDQTDPALAARVFEMRSRRTQTTQAGDRGVAVDLWPGVTDYLQQVPSKASLLEQLRSSEPLLRSLVELCVEIAIDTGVDLDLPNVGRELREAMQRRPFGQYASDRRAKERAHRAEMERVGKYRTQVQASGVPDTDMGDLPYYTHYVLPGEAEKLRAVHEAGMVADVDLTALGGPITSHEHLTVVVQTGGGKRVKVRALRDTGCPDVIISKALATHLALTVEPTSEEFGALGSTRLASFVGVARNVTVQLAPRIQLQTDVFVSPDTYPLFLLGKSIFNAEKVELLHEIRGASGYVIKLGDQVDCLPYQSLTTQQREEARGLRKQEEQAAGPSASTAGAKGHGTAHVQGYSSYDDFVRARIAAAVHVGPPPVPSSFTGFVGDRVEPIADLSRDEDAFLQQLADETFGPFLRG